MTVLTTVQRRPARSRPWAVDVLSGLAGVGLGITLALTIAAESAASMQSTGGVLTALGRGTGLASGYGMALVVLLSARIGPLERAIGQDRLIAWHRRLAPWTLWLLLAHVVLITLGYAASAHDGVLHQLWSLVISYSGMLPAALATVLLGVAGVTSYRRARRRLTHETWWAVHLYTYLALFLAYFHEVDTGASFVGHPLAKAWWDALWLGTLATVVGYRIALPMWRSVRHRLRVVEIRPEGPGVWSVVLAGRDLGRLPVAGGQFLQWRFLRRGLWWQAHPYSLSGLPRGEHLRITVKDLGDHSAGLANLRVGTRVAFEGPYGVFTADRRQTDRVLLIAAGVGATPIRAMLDELPRGVDVVVLLRASRPEDIILRPEFEAAVRRLGGKLHVLLGPRRHVRLDAASLRQLVPDLDQRDLYVCGPDEFTTSVVAAAGLPADRVHHESFAF